MALILNIETASTICSVCIAKEGEVVDYREDMSGNAHTKMLTVFIDELLKKNNFLFQEIDAEAVSAGPGSYTGLRIGLSVAKGICYALNKPLISVPTLLALAEGTKMNVNSENVFYLPVMDARRMDVYTAMYDFLGNEIIKTACVILNEAFEKSICNFGEIFVGGNGMEKCKSVFTSSNIHFIDNIYCNAKHMSTIAENKFQKNDFEDSAYFEPIYLKDYLLKK